MTEKQNIVDDTLQHHGVKGMRWGVRRYQPYPKGEKHKGKFIPKVRKKISESRVGQEYRSRKREFENMSVSDYTPEMSTKEIKSRNQRMELENSMKKLVDAPRARNANIRKMQEDAKKDYRNRARMSDEEIKRKVDRLQAIENLNQNANKQGKTLKKIGEKIANASSAMMITALTDESASMGDTVDLMSDPDKALDKVYKKQMSQSSITTEDILQHKGIKDKVL